LKKLASTGHAVHEPRTAPRSEDVVAEHVRAAAVVQEQRREQADERRLARAVLAQDRDGLTALDREPDAIQRGDASACEATGFPVAATELLAEVDDLGPRPLPSTCDFPAPS
jgi:hypothetical protein